MYGGTEVVVPYSRLNSHQDLQTGSLPCRRPGKYILVFDNSFSRWRSKVVRYRVMMRDNEGEGVAQALDQEGEEEETENSDCQLYQNMETMSL